MTTAWCGDAFSARREIWVAHVERKCTGRTGHRAAITARLDASAGFEDESIDAPVFIPSGGSKRYESEGVDSFPGQGLIFLGDRGF